MPRTSEITDRLFAGDKAAIARLVSWAENGDPRFQAANPEVYRRVGHAFRTGVTGPPGAGKSTLVNALAKRLRSSGRTVAVLAVDPSSPFSGGALLGDRIRMEERTHDAGVYIRSMASRGSHGGLARATVDACDVMDAAGYDEILVETVGVGQAEYDVVSAADTVLVVLCPGAGDGIQAMKAGLLEVADVLVVNKSDLPGADRLQVDLEDAVHVRTFRGEGPAKEGAWIAPVVPCSASKDEGIDDVADAVEKHREHLRSRGLEASRREKRLAHVRRAVEERLQERLWGQGDLAERARTLLDSGRAPYDVVEAILASILAPGRPGSDRETTAVKRGAGPA